jgi:hypothetical protein
VEQRPDNSAIRLDKITDLLVDLVLVVVAVTMAVLLELEARGHRDRATKVETVRRSALQTLQVEVEVLEPLEQLE